MTSRKLLPLDYRIPKWDLNNLNERTCPICGLSNKNIKFQRPDNLYVKLCKKCHTYYVSPSPSKEQLDKFYETYELKHRRATKIDFKDLLREYKKSDPFSDIRIRELSSMMRFEGENVLDIGFGRGFLLYLLGRLGAIPFGLELDEKAIEIADVLGINAFRGHLDDFTSEKKYTMISMLDIVEHPLNPMLMLNRASELLENGGLLMIWTPNGDFESSKENPTTFRIHLEHMQYLTTSTIAFIAPKLNLNVVHLETLGFPWLLGIDKPFSKEESIIAKVKRKIKNTPGFSKINKLRIRLNENHADERMGKYHLFCIMEKT